MEKGQKGMKWRWGGWLGEHGKFESGEGRNRGSKGDAPNISDRTASCIHLCKWGGRQLKIFYPAMQSNPWEWVVVIILGLVQGTQKIQSLCPPVNMALSDAVCPWILWAPRCRQQGMTHRAAEGSGRSTGQLPQGGGVERPSVGRSRSWGGEGKEPGRMRTLMLGKIQKKKKRKSGECKEKAQLR